MVDPTLEEQAILYVLDQLDPAKVGWFEECVRRDAELRAFVHRLQTGMETSVEAMSEAQAVEPPTARVWEQIEAETSVLLLGPDRRESETGRMPEQTAGRATGTFRLVPTALALGGWGLAAVLGLAFLLDWWRPPQTINMVTQATGEPGASSLADLDPFMVVASLTKESSGVVEIVPASELASKERFFLAASRAESLWSEHFGPERREKDEPAGFAVIDPIAHFGFIGVHDLPDPSQQNGYVLWVLDPVTDEYLPVGELPSVPGGHGLYFFEVPGEMPMHNREESQALRFAVTEEKLDDVVNQPSGNWILGGERYY